MILNSQRWLAILVLLPLTINTSSVLASDQPNENTTNNNESNLIVVSAYRDPFLNDVPETITATNIEVEAGSANATSVLSLLESTPGVFANGQGGIFQSYSIRGSAKNRIRTLVEGIPLVTERRAGVSSSFIDPLMFQSIDVMRGPVSTFYGSGALGGAINLFLLNEPTQRMILGAQDQGSGFFSHYLYGNEDLNIGISHRNFGNTENAQNQTINDAFSSTNLYLRKKWRTDTTNYEFFWLETEARDIGKSNARFNVSRNTFYPLETHSVVKFQAKHDSGWLASVFYHPNELTTDNDNLSGNFIRSENSSDDLGMTFQKETDIFESVFADVDAQWGIDWFARRDVQAFETEFIRDTDQTSRSIAIQDGELDDLALFTTLYLQRENHYWHLGARYNIQDSQVGEISNVRDTAFSAFIGLNQNITEKLDIHINVATGFRFPTLSERFFTGTTARGDIVAALDLDKEESVNFDFALSYQLGTHEWQANYFIMDVDNYIERIRLETGERTFVNLNNGRISGPELIYHYRQQQSVWQISYSSYTGEADSGEPLADIPRDELSVNFARDYDNWNYHIDWQFRRSKSDIGDGELPSGSYSVLDLSLEYQINSQWKLTANLDNALNKFYKSSNDDLETFATGRTLGFTLLWQGQ